MLNDQQKAILRSDLHRYIDLCLDLEPAMVDLAREYGGKGESGPRPKNSVSDPTGRLALMANPYRQWAKDFYRLGQVLNRLSNFALQTVGEPLPVCAGCHTPIKPEDKAQSSNGRRWHHRCDMKRRRGLDAHKK